MVFQLGQLIGLGRWGRGGEWGRGFWMALGDLMASRYSQSAVVSNHFDDCGSSHEDGDLASSSQRRDSETASSSTHGNASGSTATSMAYLPQNMVLCELRHEAFEACVPTGPSDNGLVSKWRPKDRVSLSFAIYLQLLCYCFWCWIEIEIEIDCLVIYIYIYIFFFFFWVGKDMI